MRVINRLVEIAQIKKYSKYINDKLIPETNKLIGINLVPKMSADPYTYVFETFKDEMGESRYIVLRLTTNKKELEGICWGVFMISGKKSNIGEITGDLKWDLDIIEDSYFFLLDELGRKGML